MFMIEKVMQESLFLIHVCSLEGLMLKLKFQYFGHLMQRADSFEKTLILGKIAPVFLPGESQGRGNLVGYCLWGRTGSDTTKVT